jgi:hypothetical protein
MFFFSIGLNRGVVLALNNRSWVTLNSFTGNSSLSANNLWVIYLCGCGCLWLLVVACGCLWLWLWLWLWLLFLGKMSHHEFIGVVPQSLWLTHTLIHDITTKYPKPTELMKYLVIKELQVRLTFKNFWFVTILHKTHLIHMTTSEE